MISGSELGSVVSTYLQKAPGATGPSGGPAVSRPQQGTDGVTISSQRASVSRLMSALRQLPDIRSNRVQEASGRLQTGQAPSASAVARQILSRVVGDHLAAGS